MRRTFPPTQRPSVPRLGCFDPANVQWDAGIAPAAPDGPQCSTAARAETPRKSPIPPDKLVDLERYARSAWRIRDGIHYGVVGTGCTPMLDRSRRHRFRKRAASAAAAQDRTSRRRLQAEEVILFRSDDFLLDFDVQGLRIHSYRPDDDPRRAGKLVAGIVVESLGGRSR